MVKPGIEAPPDRGEIEAELDRLLTSRTFKTRGRSRAFLRFVVEESLAGRRERIKGYTLGVEVCGRPDDFDPQADAIVRVEAGRLRKRMAHYYLTEGLEDPVLIRIPTGTYVPEFCYRAEAPDSHPPEPLPAPAAEAPDVRRPSLLARAVALASVTVLLAVFALVVGHIHQKLDHVLDRQAEIAEAVANSAALEAATVPAAARTPARGTPGRDTEALALCRQPTAPCEPAFDPARCRLAEHAEQRVVELDPVRSAGHAALGSP